MSGSDLATVLEGDCLDAMAGMADASFDAIVTDPPYGLGFLGHAWDVATPGAEWAAECLRVLKPGGHLVAFGGSRTWHRLAVAIEDAGLELRDSVFWLRGNGKPSGADLAADGWAGWHTTLRPGADPAVVARRPLDGDVRANMAAHGVGALHVDACRGEHRTARVLRRNASIGYAGSGAQGEVIDGGTGRHPANVALDEAAARDLGDDARFYYCARASVSERAGNDHPTVKPVELMRWLVRLVTPPGGRVLDPFAGSGSTLVAATLEGMASVGVERDPHYAGVCRRRLAAAVYEPRLFEVGA